MGQFINWLSLITIFIASHMADLSNMKQMRPLECLRTKNIDTLIGMICIKLFTLHTSCFTILMLEVSAVSGGYKHQQIVHP